MSHVERVLLVEDDPDMRASCRAVLEFEGHEVIEAGSAEEAEPILLREVIDAVVSDLRMPNGGGDQVLRIVKSVTPDVPVLLITAYPSVDSAIDAFRGGVADYLLKPFTGDQLVEALGRALAARRAREQASLLRGMQPVAPDMPEMIGRSEPFRAMLASIRRIAALDGNVLVTGETGSGKEVVARAVHRFSTRRARPFVAVNCAAIPENLIEAELFGYERGAFTGAVSPKRGLLEEADQGSLFLDEVAELAPSAQAKLLRCLEEKAVRRVGAVASRPVDARVVAATHKPLAQHVGEGKFREDLYYRLAVLELRVPPLRERREDVPLLASRFLDQLLAKSDRDVVGFSDEAMERLMDHPWPGNVRELQNVVQKALAVAEGRVIGVAQLSLGSVAAPAGAARAEVARPKSSAMTEFERQHVVAALERNEGNVTHAARDLGVHRTTLQRMMKRLGIVGDDRR